MTTPEAADHWAAVRAGWAAPNGFGWRPVHDPRSLDFPMLAHPEIDLAAPLTPWLWSPGEVLDQGNVGACVGFASDGVMASTPHRWGQATNAAGLAIYREAQKVDPWPGEAYEGTSVLAGVKTIAALAAWLAGIKLTYRWALPNQSEPPARQVLRALGVGPVQLGTPWFNSMSRNGVYGILTVDPASGLAGQHSTYAYGRVGSESTGLYAVCTNSWGLGFNHGGRFLLAEADLGRLLAQGGEAALISKE